MIARKKFELYQLSFKADGYKCTHCAIKPHALLFSLSHSLFLSPPVSLPQSDKLGDSLFRRKCSHHTGHWLVYSRFNLIIASSTFNQAVSVCFTLKHYSKYNNLCSLKKSLTEIKQKVGEQQEGLRHFCLTVYFRSE